MHAKNLGEIVLEVVKGVIIHQQPRWGILVGQQHQIEGWWQQEIVSALCALACRLDLRSGSYWPNTEVKPRNFLEHAGELSGAMDVYFGHWTESDKWESGEDSPRVWLELKERGTWWDYANKGLGGGNSGLAHDLAKWENKNAQWTKNDAVFLCHFTTHEGAEAEDHLPPDWQEKLEEYRRSNHSYGEPFVVGFPCTLAKGGAGMRWVRLDVFALHLPENCD